MRLANGLSIMLIAIAISATFVAAFNVSSVIDMTKTEITERLVGVSPLYLAGGLVLAAAVIYIINRLLGSVLIGVTIVGIVFIVWYLLSTSGLIDKFMG